MPWTATIGEYTKGGGALSIPVALTNGVEVIHRTFSATTIQGLKDSIRSTLTQFDAIDAVHAALPIPGSTFDFSAAVPDPPPTPTSGSYVVSALAMAKSASKNYLSLLNEGALAVDVVGVKISQELTAAVTGFVRGYRLFRTTAHSAGSLVTPITLDTNYPNLPGTITARSNGLSASVVGVPVGVAALTEDEAAGSSDAWLLDPWLEPITLRQNKGIVIQQDGAAGLGLLSAVIYFNVRQG